ncbi:type I toxin-antitoxin system Ibs family toxin, partial [Escherichia coli]|nr:type I toxin-antitoxin system Ibs family toxin [Escherichia coli]
MMRLAIILIVLLLISFPA